MKKKTKTIKRAVVDPAASPVHSMWTAITTQPDPPEIIAGPIDIGKATIEDFVRLATRMGCRVHFGLDRKGSNDR